MRRPICVDCQIEMVPLKTGFIVEIMAGANPYQKVMGDKYGCPNCNIEVVVGFGAEPITEHWRPGYAAELAHLQVWSNISDQARYDNMWGKGALAEMRCRMTMAAKEASL